jgi:hypothetical protein
MHVNVQDVQRLQPESDRTVPTTSSQSYNALGVNALETYFSRALHLEFWITTATYSTQGNVPPKPAMHDGPMHKPVNKVGEAWLQ